MFDFIKRYALKKHLAANTVERDRQIVSLRNAKNIGMVCEISDEDSYKDVFAVFSKLQTISKVQMVGYIDENAVPFYCLEQLAADYFCKKNLNWYGKPDMVQIDDFVNTDFDILIDFTKSSLAPIHYILTLTRASFVTGGNQYNKEYYDLTIEGEGLSNKKLLENVYIYTQKLKGE